MLFHVLFQCQIAVTTGFMEETWSRNLLNIMTTPITEGEYAAGLALYAFMKLIMAIATISLVAFITYQFNLGSIGWGLVPIIGVLLLVGWAVSLLVIGLILRYGQSAEILAWGTNFVLLALSGVFNPISALPAAVQPIARILPTTFAFRAMRTLLDGGGIPWDDVLWGYAGALVCCVLGYWFIIRMLETFRRRGYVTRFS
jgi:ABC-2 type transport system permease protein